MSNWKKIIISGSNAELNSLLLNSGSLTINGGNITVTQPGIVYSQFFQGTGFGSAFVGTGFIGAGAQLTGSYSGSLTGRINGILITVGTVEPTSPQPGDLWIDTN